MESIQSITETSRASLELLYKISKEFAAALDLNTVLNRVLMLSIRHVDAACGSIIVLDERGNPLETAFLMPGCHPDTSALQLRANLRARVSWLGGKTPTTGIDKKYQLR